MVRWNNQTCQFPPQRRSLSRRTAGSIPPRSPYQRTSCDGSVYLCGVRLILPSTTCKHATHRRREPSMQGLFDRRLLGRAVAVAVAVLRMPTSSHGSATTCFAPVTSRTALGYPTRRRMSYPRSLCTSGPKLGLLHAGSPKNTESRRLCSWSRFSGTRTGLVHIHRSTRITSNQILLQASTMLPHELKDPWSCCLLDKCTQPKQNTELAECCQPGLGEKPTVHDVQIFPPLIDLESGLTRPLTQSSENNRFNLHTSPPSNSLVYVPR